MTLDRILAVTGVSVGCIALALSICIYSLRDELADEALRRRETALCQYAAPKFAKAYEDLIGDSSFDAKTFHPRTLEELFTPYGIAMRKIIGVGEVPPALPR